jgi:exopolysaccharide production protein ExoZ
MPELRRTILPIQYLRGVAALLVVWHHTTALNGLTLQYYASRFGTAGVDVFFAISGFVMVLTCSGRKIAPLDFLRHRLIRIAPIYWALTGAMVLLAVLPPYVFGGLSPTPRSTLLSLLFVPHYSDTRPAQIWPLLVPGWTLNFEMFFYLLFAGSLLAQRRATQVLVGSCITLVAVGLVVGPFDGALARSYTSPLLLEFAGGAVVARLWQRGWLKPTVPLALLAAAAGAGLLLFGPSDHGSWSRQIGAWLVLGACLCPAWHKRWPALETLGNASYSIYLTHVFTLAAVTVSVGHLGLPAKLAGATLAMALAMLACTAVGVAVYRWVELPLTALMRRHFDGRRKSAPGLLIPSRVWPSR